MQGSRLSQRIKRSYERSTGLREVATASSPEADETRPPGQQSSAPHGAHDDEPDAEKTGTSQGRDEGYPEDPDDDDDALEREMLAAFEDGNFDSKAEEDVAAENG